MRFDVVSRYTMALEQVSKLFPSESGGCQFLHVSFEEEAKINAVEGKVFLPVSGQSVRCLEPRGGAVSSYTKCVTRNLPV